MNKVCKKCNNAKELSDFYQSDKYQGGYIHTCKSCFRKRNSTYKLQNKEKIKIGNNSWKSMNRNYVNSKQIEWRKTYSLSENQVLANLLRNRLNKAIRSNRPGSAVRDLGRSIEEFKNYLESKFTPEMSWSNRGLKGWHIDHIIPLSAFDLTNPEELKKACHYTNLQPLWWNDNLSKGGF